MYINLSGDNGVNGGEVEREKMDWIETHYMHVCILNKIFKITSYNVLLTTNEEAWDSRINLGWFPF